MGGLIGARIPRLEDGALLIGKGRFVDDIARPGVLHAAFVRSPHPHAAIRRVDAQTRWRCRAFTPCSRSTISRRSSPSAGCCATPIPGRRSTATGRSRSPTARCPMSARRSRSCWPTTATSPRTPRRWSRSTTTCFPPCRTAASAIEPAAPAVRRELNTNIAAAYKVAYGDVEAAFARPRTSSTRSFGSIAAPPIRSKAAAFSRNGATTP